MKKLMSSILTRLISLALVILTVAAIAFSTVYYTKNESGSGTSMELSGAFEDSISAALEGSIYGENVKKINIIPQRATSGSKPNEASYKSTTDKDEVLEAAKQAENYGLIRLDELSFSQDTVIARGSTIEYYLDESIFVVCWKESGAETVYNYSEIGIAHASQFRKYITENKYGSNKRLTTSTMAKDANAVVAINGDFYGYRSNGIVVYQSAICRLQSKNGTHHCFVDSKGDLIVTREYLSGSESTLQSFIDENSINFSLAFGPILVENSKVLSYSSSGYIYGQVADKYSRAAIGQLGERHYLLCTADGGVAGTKGTTINVIARKMGQKGCITAYALDGGQTATIVFNNKVFNRVGYGSERLITDMLYFASSVED